MADPKAKKPSEWDEDAPRMIEDPEDEKPEGWLDDEPEEVDDPGEACLSGCLGSVVVLCCKHGEQALQLESWSPAMRPS